MTTNHHTPIPSSPKQPANAQTFNDRLSELDQAISDLALTEKDGHIIQEEGVDLPQQQRLNFVGAGVSASNDPGNNRTVVTIPNDHGGLSGLGDDDHPQYSMKYADTPSLAVNGNFEFAQEQTPGTYTTIADKGYGPDQWWVTRENADVQYRREDGTGEAGITSKYFGTFKKITNTGKFFICQPLEGRDSVPLRGKTVIFPIKLKASASKTIRMAVLELQTGGTMDAPPATLVTAFGANGVDPTFGANVAIITAAQSKAVTTAFQQFSVSVTVPNNSKNLFLAIWTNDQFAVNDTLSLAEADFYPGSALRAWLPRDYDDSLAMCRRYFFKTFDIDVAPAQNAGVAGCARGIAGKAGATALAAIIKVRFPVRMFVTPTVTTFNPSAANAQVRDSSGAGADCTATAPSPSHTNPDATTISATGNASTAVGNIMDVHITAKARIL